MQRRYRAWRQAAVVRQSPLSQNVQQELEQALESGSPVVIDDTLLVVDANQAFVTGGNREGRFIHGQNHLGYVCAAADSADKVAIKAAIVWAETQANSPDGDGHGPFSRRE